MKQVLLLAVVAAMIIAPTEAFRFRRHRANKRGITVDRSQDVAFNEQ